MPQPIQCPNAAQAGRCTRHCPALQEILHYIKVAPKGQQAAASPMAVRCLWPTRRCAACVP